MSDTEYISKLESMREEFFKLSAQKIAKIFLNAPKGSTASELKGLVHTNRELSNYKDIMEGISIAISHFKHV